MINSKIEQSVDVEFLLIAFDTIKSCESLTSTITLRGHSSTEMIKILLEILSCQRLNNILMLLTGVYFIP